MCVSNYLPSSGPAGGFFLLEGRFSSPLFLVWGQALGFWKAPRDHFDRNRRRINKDELNWVNFDEAPSIQKFSNL